MRNFVITVNGKSYQVGVEEVGATANAPVVTSVAPVAAAPVAAPKAAPAPAPQAAKPVAANGEKRSAYSRFGGNEDG